MCPSGLFDGVREVTLDELLNELKDVDDWFELGVYLNVPDHKLREIGQDYGDTDECMIEMILLWRQLCVPTWKAITTALSDIGMHALAVKIAHKYGEYTTRLTCVRNCFIMPFNSCTKIYQSLCPHSMLFSIWEQKG